LHVLQARFVHELQLEDMPSTRAELRLLDIPNSPGAQKVPYPPPKAINDPPNEVEERDQLRYYREVAARQRLQQR